MTPQAAAAFATLLSFAPHGNRVELRLDRGSAELVWTAPTAFHFRRSLDGPLAELRQETTPAVGYTTDDRGGTLHLRSQKLDVAIARSGALVSVRGPDGAPLMADLSEPRAVGGGIAWEREAPSGARFYGLGMREDPDMDLRGRKVDSLDPFLISTAGYGEQHMAPSAFDFTAPGRYRIQSPQVDYYFFYGPKPKDILEQRVAVPQPDLGLYRLPATWTGLRNRLVETVHAAMTSPVMLPLTFSGQEKAPAELQARIHQLASLTPTLPPFFDPSLFRRELAAFFGYYAIETRDRHFAVWHPLPFEFPDDAESARHADEFLLGDELLVAPIYESGNKRQVYFPPGRWTDLDSGRQYPGRRTAIVISDRLPVFAHEGAIVPFDLPGGAIALHYFAKLPGEFFVLEKDTGGYTQIHAAPAGDILRLEIAARADRVYRWMVHHAARPAAVTSEDRPVEWSYDAAQQILSIELHVKGGEDNVLHVSW